METSRVLVCASAWVFVGEKPIQKFYFVIAVHCMQDRVLWVRSRQNIVNIHFQLQVDYFKH